jgi:hypothetical protein
MARLRASDIAVALRIVLALGLCALALSRAAGAQADGALALKSADAAEIVRGAAHGPVRVIVSYRPPDCALDGAPGSATDIDWLRAANRAMQDAIIADHFGAPQVLGRERALRRMEITPAFGINASRDEVEALARDDRVTHIGLDAVRGRPSR